LPGFADRLPRYFPFLDLLVDGRPYREVEGSLKLRHGAGHARAMLRYGLACYALDAGRIAARDLG